MGAALNWLRRLLRLAYAEQVPELDLHGLRVPEALDAVAGFLSAQEHLGVEEARIVCGKGRHSPGGRGVLREAVAGWLTAHGYQGRFRRELERDGLDGALRVRLGDPKPPREDGVSGPASGTPRC